MADHIDNALLRHDEIIANIRDRAWLMIHADEEKPRNKYHREIKPGVWVDVYDVLAAWAVDNPALQHLIKKSLQPGERGHKTREQDLADIVASAKRAQELEQ
ncbi:hypothetical protein KUV74_12400 [Halomonas sp. DP1Y21-3]|uniref:hypothetical protein n=1 Tax=Halomonas sp. DP1Y21-3 TaxID=2859080 RepID=UPI001C9683D4|nr:hypothetical protein [Halomonas sp. DP1Y21-3]MBY6111194.1 hypothetical protein [Halomonas sp. DP1Y21-3]